jgi:hypothetical protein
MNEHDLQIKYPSVPWREPIPVTLTDMKTKGLACRLCIALVGLKSSDVGLLPKTRAEFDAHMKEKHP